MSVLPGIIDRSISYLESVNYGWAKYVCVTADVFLSENRSIRVETNCPANHILVLEAVVGLE